MARPGQRRDRVRDPVKHKRNASPRLACVAERAGAEARDDREARLPIVARWAELVEDARRPGVETTDGSRLRRLIADLRSPSRLPARGREWLRRRAIASRRSIARPADRPARPSEEDWLEPILVDCFGRDGSTLMMHLLASSPQIALGARYPYEDRYFTYLWRWSRLLDRMDWPRDLWGSNEVCSVSQEGSLPLLGPPPWLPRDLMEEAANGQAMSSRCFELVWQEFSRRAREHRRTSSRGDRIEPRYYAEKHLDTWKLRLDELPPVKLVVLLRDPRDVWVSVQAFEQRQPGVADFRARGTVSPEDQLRYQIARQRDRLRWIAEVLEDDEALVVRYEDLVLDLPSVADRLERRLGVSLDVEGVGGQDSVFKRHASSDAPEASIGRWRKELDPAVADLFAEDIGAELRALGFES